MDDLSISDLYLPTALALITALLYQYVLYPAVFSPLSRIPNAHWSCSISPAWILWARFKSRENRTLHLAHQLHGPIVRLGPNELSVNSVEAVKTIYQGGFDKHQWYSIFNNYGVPCMFSFQQSKPHSTRKRMISHVYSKSHLASSRALALQARAILTTRLLPIIASSKNLHGVDVHSLFSGAAMDLIAAYCFGLGRTDDFIRNAGYRAHWLALYATRSTHGFFAQELPRLSRLLSFLGVPLLAASLFGGDDADAANRELEAWCKAHCDATIQQLKAEAEAEAGRESKSSVDTANDPAVVRALLAGIAKEEARTSTTTNDSDLSLLVASEIFDHVLAGHETTGVALTYLSYHLSQSPSLQRTLREELLSAAAKPTTTTTNSSSSRVAVYPDARQLDRLPVLHAVVMETVRRYTPAGGPEPRVTPHHHPHQNQQQNTSSPGCLIGPYPIPPGVRVSASAYNLHRDATVFPDPEKWDHTRWLRRRPHPRSRDRTGKEEEEGEEMESNGYQLKEKDEDVNRHFWGFSSGGRMCLGSNFAMHEMKLIIAAIYANYTSHVVDDEGVEPTDAYTGHPKSGSLYLRYERVI
ncbi:cytochrome P450 [Hypoxylon fragiforme]|uniref:cytochrome P450 n=1 Tax=Hypoxylon fragiforme TaxID=63214 RepID=UPI0020C65F7F|nr:cytochrome P450 [Hypoxylon fragiforme]KAI2610294.1 cytochrome P450 [Hypoxylon fragiforme]